jgi:hypothetical protein
LRTSLDKLGGRARIGHKNGQVRQWAKRGTGRRQPADQRYDNAHLFVAICPARGVGAALALPHADADMMQLHLDEISRTVVEGAHAVLLRDSAGWHTRRGVFQAAAALSYREAIPHSGGLAAREWHCGSRTRRDYQLRVAGNRRLDSDPARRRQPPDLGLGYRDGGAQPAQPRCSEDACPLHEWPP